MTLPLNLGACRIHPIYIAGRAIRMIGPGSAACAAQQRDAAYRGLFENLIDSLGGLDGRLRTRITARGDERDSEKGRNREF
jgi:hypothetical protein